MLFSQMSMIINFPQYPAKPWGISNQMREKTLIQSNCHLTDYKQSRRTGTPQDRRTKVVLEDQKPGPELWGRRTGIPEDYMGHHDRNQRARTQDRQDREYREQTDRQCKNPRSRQPDMIEPFRGPEDQISLPLLHPSLKPFCQAQSS